MPRHSFCRQSKLTDLKGRIDYISNPDRQEHLYAVYSTTENPDFWNELIVENQREYEKYNCVGRLIEGREWIIALEESLVELDQKKILHAFVDSYKEKYGVECIAGLHHNKAMSNYHIHLIFSEKKRLEEPENKIATRNMFYDESGKHRRTKKEICNLSGEVRSGCKVILKGDRYEQTLFSGKDPQFKTKQFIHEVKELFTEVNNRFIQKEDRKLQVFDSDSVYLATKKISRDFSKAIRIQDDNECRRKWNLTADQALVAGVPEEDILQIKKEQIASQVKTSIIEKGRNPELFQSFVKKAIHFLNDKIHTVKIPKEPVLKVNMKEFQEMKKIKETLKVTEKKISQIEKQMKSKEEYMGKLLFPRKKAEVLKEIVILGNGKLELQRELGKVIAQKGYSSVQSFMKAYQKSVVAIQMYDAAMEAYKTTIEKGETMMEKPERDSVKLKLQGYMDKAKEQDGKEIGRKKNRGVEEL